ncbi:MAG: SDR family oxidoreductase [Alphaproteobacteria bacterium]|jgi:3-oxoacyl-[acyl-carrier protein] reductase|nr:SDR family oxidoreductase [Alphaproteobacteria bacterium]
MDRNLAGQVAVITGAGRGIGRAVARAYAEAGMRVVCAARSTPEIEAVAAAIRATGGEAAAVACDVTEPDQVEALCARAEDFFGGIDIMFVNAGIDGPPATVAEAAPEAWARVIQVNLIGAMHQCQAAIPRLRRRGGGKIIVTGSGIGRFAPPGSSAYGASKAGLALLVRTLALELREDRIAVNELIPGPVKTAMTGLAAEAEAAAADAAEVAKRFGADWLKAPDDVAPLALFMVGLPNDGPTGQRYSLVGRDIGP